MVVATSPRTMTVVTNPARTDSDDDTNDHNENDTPFAEGPPLASNSIPRAEDHDPDAEPSRLYNTEDGSDIVFVAGINNDTWRYPAHRDILRTCSPIFSALLSDMKTDVIIVDYVDRRGFEQLLRYLYSEPTQLNSVMTTRLALDAAYKFLCTGLTQKCARRLDELLDAGVALEILHDLRFLCARLPGAASAPPLTAFDNNRSAYLLAECSQWCDSLAHNTLLVIDEYADAALQDERLEELPYEDLALVVKRETLRVSSEMVLIEALSRWATAYCKRHKRELTSANKRAALGELSYCPRYLLLEGEELSRALALELLESMERTLVLARSRKLSAPIPVGAEQEALLRRWARARPTQPAALPVHLSARSEPHAEEEEVPASGLCVRRPKRLKPPSFAPDEPIGVSAFMKRWK